MRTMTDDKRASYTALASQIEELVGQAFKGADDASKHGESFIDKHETYRVNLHDQEHPFAITKRDGMFVVYHRGHEVWANNIPQAVIGVCEFWDNQADG